jgi:hypothetical protein
LIENRGVDFDIKTLLRVFLVNKWTFVCFFIISIFVGTYLIKKSPILYSAHAIFETQDSEPSEVILSNQLPSGLSSFLPGIGGSAGSQGLIPKLLGSQFIEELIVRFDIQKKLNMSFELSNPSMLSLAGILDFLNVYKIDLTSTAEQANDRLINYIRSLIVLKPYKYGQLSTTAFKVIVNHSDPHFAAFLANSIVQLHFELNQRKQKEKFEETVLFLSRKLAEAKIDFDKANETLDSFILSNSRKVSEFNGFNAPGNVRGGINAPLYELGGIELRKNNLVQTIDLLSDALSKEKIVDLATSFSEEFRQNLSNEYLSEVNKIRSSNLPDNKKQQKILEITDPELDRLNGLVSSLTQLIKDRKEETQAIIELDDTLKDLNFNLELKKQYYENIKATVQEKSLEAGAIDMNKGTIYSTAVPPIYPYSPNVRQTMFFSIIFFQIGAFLFVIFNQIRRKYVLDLRQIDKNFDRLHRAEVSNRRQLRLKNLRKGILDSHIGLDPSFLKKLNDGGRVGCIIQVSTESLFPRNYDICDKVTHYIGNMLPNKDSRLCCISAISSPYKESYTSKISNQILPEQSIGEKSLSKFGNVYVTDRKKLIGENEFFPLSEDLKKFDKILISSGDGDNSVIKYNLIDSCDFFVLVLVIGSTTIEQIDNYFTSEQLVREKCAGIILVT